VEELQGVVDYGVISSEGAIDSDWFPHTRSNGGVYWTSSQFNADTNAAYIVEFQYGARDGTPRTNQNISIRLVRGSPAGSAAFTYETAPYGTDAAGNVVVDLRTGYRWRRCSEGQVWDGSVCVGEAAKFLHEEALSRAQFQPGWRLPNVKELASVAAATNVQIADHNVVFPGVLPEPYWTATPFLPITGGNVWYVNFTNGSVYGWPRSRSDGRFNVRLILATPR
jgi:hypothetical protein